jgi:predicted RND superfamily exporter protein
MSRLVTEDQRQARMRAQIPDWGSYIIEQKNEAFYQFLEQELPNRQLTYTITGTPHLIDLNNRFLAQNVLKGLLIALLVIALIFAVLFRSARLMLITLVPNVLPLVFIGGLMGFMGIDLKISTSIIFIIAFGIAVDDSIHFLSRFQREYKRQPLLDAVRTTYLTTGKAIVVTSLILLGGFMSFCLSGFEGTFYVGLLVSITLLVALIADLTILPVLLARLLRKK